MERKLVLLVGLTYPEEPPQELLIETRGLCDPASFPMLAARPLYDYDVIIIYPQSYSHFMFGTSTVHSASPKELWDLKSEDNKQDLDNCFNRYEREQELLSAISRGTRVIWIVTPDKYIHFFGQRSLYVGYSNRQAAETVRRSSLSSKTSAKLSVQPTGQSFRPYFDVLALEGWRLCWDPLNRQEVDQTALALTPDGYWLGAKVTTDSGTAWMLTPPPTPGAVARLVECALNVNRSEVKASRYHGIFLSHNHEDKPFVRRLRDSLVEHGVTNVWVDEAEIMIGDSLIHKIEEGIQKTEYFGAVLSPRSVGSSWVQRELELALTLEINSRAVKVLPLLLEPCDLPAFLKTRLYADFTADANFEAELQKVLRRLEKRS